MLLQFVSIFQDVSYYGSKKPFYINVLLITIYKETDAVKTLTI